MKKFLLSLMILFSLCFSAWALPDILNPAVKTADAQIKATPGVVYQVIVSYAGVTAGDKIEIKNSADNSGTSNITVVAPAANGTTIVPLPIGTLYTTAIYYDETKSGGTFTTQIFYF